MRGRLKRCLPLGGARQHPCGGRGSGAPLVGGAVALSPAPARAWEAHRCMPGQGYAKFGARVGCTSAERGPRSQLRQERGGATGAARGAHPPFRREREVPLVPSVAPIRSSGASVGHTRAKRGAQQAPTRAWDAHRWQAWWRTPSSGAGVGPHQCEPGAHPWFREERGGCSWCRAWRSTPTSGGSVEAAPVPIAVTPRSTSTSAGSTPGSSTGDPPGFRQERGVATGAERWWTTRSSGLRRCRVPMLEARLVSGVWVCRWRATPEGTALTW
jgi:hypothetical protein